MTPPSFPKNKNKKHPLETIRALFKEHIRAVSQTHDDDDDASWQIDQKHEQLCFVSQTLEYDWQTMQNPNAHRKYNMIPRSIQTSP